MQNKNKYDDWDHLISEYSPKKTEDDSENIIDIESDHDNQSHINRKSIGLLFVIVSVFLFVIFIIIDPNEMHIPWTLIVIPLGLLGLALIFGFDIMFSFLDNDANSSKHETDRNSVLRDEYRNYLLKQKSDYEAFYVRGNRNMKQPEKTAIDYETWKSAKSKDLR